MEITKIECIPVSLPIKKPHFMASPGTKPIKGKDDVVVKVHTDEGIVGIGESGLPMPRRGDTVESIMGIINRVFGPQILLGEDPFNIEKIVAKMDTVAKGNNQAKTAIDFALHDIMGKKLGVPVYKLLGGLSNEKVPMRCTLKELVGRETPQQLAERAVKLLEGTGTRAIKVKVARVGATVEEDVNNVKAVREAIDPDVMVMIDTNEGWDYCTALRTLKKMKNLDIDHVEQPVPWWDIDGLARLRRSQDIPVWSDESGAELSQVLEIIQKDAVDGLQIKISCIGGLLKAKKWVSICQAADLPVKLGMMGGSGLTAAAQIHFTAANEWMGRWPAHGNLNFLELHEEALDTVSTPIKDDLVINVPRYEKGFMYPPDGPGLGVELNEALLRELLIRGMSPTVIGKK